KPGEAVPALFGSTGVWEPAAVRDAAFALKSTQTKPRPEGRADRAVTWVRLADAPVTATAFAADSGDVFVGFRDGALVRFSPTVERAHRIEGEAGEIRGLATNRDGGLVVAANRLGDGPILLTAYTCRNGPVFHRTGGFQSQYRFARL